MDSEKVKAINGFVVIDILEIKPAVSGINLLNPHTMRETGSRESYTEHPYQALVIRAPRVFYNGGFEYLSEIHEGDVALLTGFPIPERTAVVNIDGKNYPLVRYAEIPLVRTPTEEERSKFIFAQDAYLEEERKNRGLPEVSTVIADRVILHKTEDKLPKEDNLGE